MERGYSGSRIFAGRNDFQLSTQGLGRVVKRTCGEQLSAAGQCVNNRPLPLTDKLHAQGTFGCHLYLRKAV
jgi:hypothetical protein